MADRPTVAAVVTCFNYADYVQEAVRSLLDQTEPFAQVVVVDDGSQDGSADLVEALGEPVTVIRQQNGGQLDASRTGLAAVDADYVYFLDADDAAEPGLVASVLPLLAGRPAKVQFPVRAVDETGTEVGSVFPAFPDGYTAADMRRDNAQLGFYTCPTTSGNVYRRDALLSHDLGSLVGSDSSDGVPALLMPYLGEVVSLSEPLARYRVHATSKSQYTAPSPALLRRERDRIYRRWSEVCALLGRPQPPFGPDRPAFVLERDVMLGVLERTGVRPGDLAALVARWWASRLPARQKVVLTGWAALLLVPVPALRHRLVMMRRAPRARPRWARAAAAAVGVAGGRR